jgi:hypothetical protein
MNSPAAGREDVVAPPRAASAATAVRALSVIVLVVETVSVALSMADRSWTIFLLAHIAAIATLLIVIVAFDRRGFDSTQIQKLAFLTFVGGPIGAAAGILSEGSLWKTEARELTAWYETIAPREDAAVTLVDQIIDDRLVSNASQLPRRFDTLLATGSAQEKRAVLAYLALESGNAEMPEALRLALRSPDQGVRVQAAAVAAHVRDKARHRTKTPVAASVNLPIVSASRPSPTTHAGRT